MTTARGFFFGLPRALATDQRWGIACYRCQGRAHLRQLPMLVQDEKRN